MSQRSLPWVRPPTRRPFGVRFADTTWYCMLIPVVLVVELLHPEWAPDGASLGFSSPPLAA